MEGERRRRRRARAFRKHQRPDGAAHGAITGALLGTPDEHVRQKLSGDQPKLFMRWLALSSRYTTAEKDRAERFRELSREHQAKASQSEPEGGHAAS